MSRFSTLHLISHNPQKNTVFSSSIFDLNKEFSDVFLTLPSIAVDVDNKVADKIVKYSLI